MSKRMEDFTRSDSPREIRCSVTRPRVLPRRGRGEVRVENADLLPVLLVVRDELQVPRVLLVLVLGRLVGEDHVQRDVEISDR